MITGGHGGEVQPSQPVARNAENFVTRLLPDSEAADVSADAPARRGGSKATSGAAETAPRFATTPTAADLYALRGGPEALLTAAEVAERLRVCTETVYRLCKRGVLPHLRILDTVRVRPADLAAFVSARTRSGKVE
jgi:excisionase family DNA binding protein